MSILGTYNNFQILSLTSWTVLVESILVNKSFDFESIFVHEDTFKDTIRATSIEKLVPISVSISSNFVEEQFFLCNSDPHNLIAFFNGTPENSASQVRQKWKICSSMSRQQ